MVGWASWPVRLVKITAMIAGTGALGTFLKAMNWSFYPGAPWWMVLCDAWIFTGTVSPWTRRLGAGRSLFAWLAVAQVGVPLASALAPFLLGHGLRDILHHGAFAGIRDWASRSRTRIYSPAEPALTL